MVIWVYGKRDRADQDAPLIVRSARWRGWAGAATTLDMDPLITTLSTELGLKVVRRILPSCATSDVTGSDLGRWKAIDSSRSFSECFSRVARSEPVGAS